ncbi:hydrogenase [Proteobacteria bacterium 005FR1]|nr:hydrogenase [Proteobacteria bacterium 005FR1]
MTSGGSRRGWLLMFAFFALLSLIFLYTIMLVFTVGVGMLGINIPVAWGFPIINVVWWIGIGHAGTLISAILLLLRQGWRAPISRFAEAMTLFAAGIAGMMPIIHLGRPWFFYWLVPYPATMGVWPQWRSPLVWDFFAIATYITVSLLFWYLGLVPDLGSMRDRAKTKLGRRIYGVFALGWRGAASHWRRYQTAYLLIAGLATPLVVSVHSVIALDFAVTLVPGYHSQVFPPYFVAGALFSGFAMVLTLTIPMRRIFRLYDLITSDHLEVMAKIMLAAGLVVIYGYVIEYFLIWYDGDEYHIYLAFNRMFGPYAPYFWGMMFINVLLTQSLWFPKVRRSAGILFAVAVVLNVGMWLERYVIVIISTNRDFLPSSWNTSFGTWVDWSMLLGSLGLFFALFLLFIRAVPAISIFEEKELEYEHEHEESGRS